MIHSAYTVTIAILCATLGICLGAWTQKTYLETRVSNGHGLLLEEEYYICHSVGTYIPPEPVDLTPVPRPGWYTRSSYVPPTLERSF